MFTVKAYKIYFKKDIKYLTNYLFWVSLIAQLVKNPPAMQETPVWFLGQEDPLEKGKATHSDLGLENSMDCIVHRVAKSQTRLSDFHYHYTITIYWCQSLCGWEKHSIHDDRLSWAKQSPVQSPLPPWGFCKSPRHLWNILLASRGQASPLLG